MALLSASYNEMQLTHVQIDAEDLHFIKDESFPAGEDERKEDTAFIPHYVLTNILEKLAASDITEESMLETLDLSRVMDLFINSQNKSVV